MIKRCLIGTQGVLSEVLVQDQGMQSLRDEDRLRLFETFTYARHASKRGNTPPSNSDEHLRFNTINSHATKVGTLENPAQERSMRHSKAMIISSH